MPAFSEANIETVVTACSENIAAIAESLQLNIDFHNPLESGPRQSWDAEAIPERFNGPGLVVVIEVEGQAIVCLIPESLPLPAWYTAPDVSETSRLQTIAMEWGLNLLPEDIEPERTETIGVDNLRDSLIEAGPAEGAVVVELRVQSAAGDSVDENPAAEPAEESDDEAAATDEAASEEPATDEATADDASPSILIVLPVENPPKAPEIPVEETPVSAPAPASPAPVQATAMPAASPSAAIPRRSGTNRLLPLPVTVSVRLAEKKIEMGSLLKLTPGMLVKFSKSCDDYLELYVNNFRYCRGEAIKIGEKFGLKVKDVGVVDEREERILEL